MYKCVMCGGTGGCITPDDDKLLYSPCPKCDGQGRVRNCQCFAGYSGNCTCVAYRDVECDWVKEATYD